MGVSRDRGCGDEHAHHGFDQWRGPWKLWPDAARRLSYDGRVLVGLRACRNRCVCGASSTGDTSTTGDAASRDDRANSSRVIERAAASLVNKTGENRNSADAADRRIAADNRHASAGSRRTPVATQPIGPPPVDTVPPDPYQPNNSADQARSIGELRMAAPALAIESTFDTAADWDDYFTVRILDDGSVPDPNVLKYTDHHLVLSYRNPAYALGDYPLYQITVTATTGVAYTGRQRQRCRPASPSRGRRPMTTTARRF